jgi:POT family proton-dependent oligopeptide transporter
MFKGHPKGLYVLFFTEMWERFGFYTMLAIFVYYMQENFKWDAATATNVYGLFLAGVYITPLIGGWLADNLLGYGKTITIGAVVMAIGYIMMAIPTSLPLQLYVALFVVCVGNGLFKANISVLVGNLYAHTQGSLKDAGYNIFYMGINVGAFYAPMAAAGIKRFVMEHLGVSLAEGYNAGFAVAAVGMVISLLIFLIFRKHYSKADYRAKEKDNTDVDIVLTKPQEKERIIALMTIFAIVIFFWMAFHQNGSALSLFARDYTDVFVGKFTYLLFDVIGLHAILFVLLGGGAAFVSKAVKAKGLGGLFAVVGIIVIIIKLNLLGNHNEIEPEQFQSFNPMFIVLLTPIVVGWFAFLNKKGKEPSSPAKIGIGMIVTGLAYIIMVIAVTGLPSMLSLAGGSSSITVSAYWLMGTYFVLTIAELHLPK